MKTVCKKISIQEANRIGYQGDVIIPVLDDMEHIEHGELAVTVSNSDKSIRTLKQNAAIHMYCAMLAERFESGGFDMQTVLEKAVPVKWTMEGVKEVIWRRIQTAMFPEKTSTTQLETKDVSEIYSVISRHMSESFNITQSFPNRHGD
jgi:hypothetical protein